MAYTVKQLAKIAGVSVRTLHFYDEAGLLKPSSIERNGYRKYEEKELLLLQQILFFKELDFSLGDIKKMITARNFDMVASLQDHKQLIELKKKRLTGLLKTIDKTITKLTKKKMMNDEELYDAFSDEEQKKYQEEAKQRWGNTKAYKQSQERTKNWTKEDYARVKKAAEEFMKRVVAVSDKPIASKEVQAIIREWRQGIDQFYDTTLEMCRNLGEMYVADPRFTKYYDKHKPGLAVFMRDAINYYCDHAEK